jgi:hypothetical protein
VHASGNDGSGVTIAVIDTGVGTGTGPLTIAGTSMSAPHVAGVEVSFPDVVRVAGTPNGWAEGFTLAGEDELILDDAFNAFETIGYRTNSFAAQGDLVEFGIASEKTWETFAAAEIDIFIDVDGDGIDDSILVVAYFDAF